MSGSPLDDVDERILYLLQEDARNNTNAEISEQVDISPSTVGQRIKQLEKDGIIVGYQPNIDYNRADFPLRVLLICTSTIMERSDAVQQIRKLSGVVNVRELMTGSENVHVEVVGKHNEDITRSATAIDNIGIEIEEEILVKDEYPQPANVFGDHNKRDREP